MSRILYAASLVPFDLFRLHNRHKLCAKDTIPEAAGHTKSILVVKEVVLKVVFLETLVPKRQVLVMEEVVRHVVARVTEEAAAEYRRRHVPVPEEEGVRQFPEWDGKSDEEGGWHDEAILIHGQVMMDTVEQEMRRDADPVVW